MGKVGQIFLTLAIALVPWVLAINILRVSAGGTQLYTYTILQELSKVDISFSRTVGKVLDLMSANNLVTPWADIFQWTGNFLKDIGVFFTGIMKAFENLIQMIFGVFEIVVMVPVDFFEFVQSVANFMYFLVGFDLSWFPWH